MMVAVTAAQLFTGVPAGYACAPASLETGILDGAIAWQHLWCIVVPTMRRALPVGMQEFVNLEGGTKWAR